MVAAAIVIFSSFFDLTAVFKGIGTMLAAFLGICRRVHLGGEDGRRPGRRDARAAALLFGGIVTAAGGIGAIAHVRAAPATRHLFSWNAAMPFAALFGIIVAGTMKLMVEPRQLSRFYALRDAAAVRLGFWVATLSFLIVYALLVPGIRRAESSR